MSDTLNVFDNTETRTPILICKVYDARGNGGGTVAPTITGDHQNRITDYTAIVLQGIDENELLHRERTSKSAISSENGRSAELPGRSAEDNRGGTMSEMIVRRLTPLECERLQGYPDGWTDIGEWTDTKGKKHKESDSSRYRALGNSLALPFWEYLAEKMCKQYDRPVTMGSLFDGIGGFPLVFSRCGATPVWASEIEEFPIAVTKIHFPEEE